MGSPQVTTGASQGLLAPGIALAGAIAILAFFLEPVVQRALPLPALVIALLIGIALHGLAARPVFAPGLKFCVSRVLRIAVALLGLRVALGDIYALGLTTALIVVVAMIATVMAGLGLARLFGQSSAFGALAGTATAVCGASAALATSTVLPDYKGKEADVVFVIVAVNLLSTVAMLAYAPLAHWLGMDLRLTGVLIGGSIHDVAQVVGAGFAVSDETGTIAVIVKLFRVLLLLPFVMAIGWAFARSGAGSSRARVPVPVFALGFLALCLVNSAMPMIPEAAAVYAPVKAIAGQVSTWGLLIAIAALGLGTSVSAIANLGIRHVLTVTGTTLVILAVVVAGLLLGMRAGVLL
ncbi:MAG: putative sulfate exporter family transporter [Beijerinckiaceae bacterium]|nr:putative sulfate exporter family transporter [Beijerinckiaceae bacterium]MDO9442725.1 putative sulfate exporter family transporter [Beijerinckiaceae bacterium]